MQDLNQNLPDPSPTPPPSGPPGGGPPHINPLTGKPGDMARPATPPKPLDEKPGDMAKPVASAPHAAPKDQSWTLINIAKSGRGGIFKNKELFKPKNIFLKNVRDQVRHGKNAIRSFSVAKEFAEKLAPKRGRGLTRAEIKKTINNMDISNVQKRMLKRNFGTGKK